MPLVLFEHNTKKFLFTFKVATIHRNKKQTENQETVNIRGHGNEVDEED